MKHKHSQLGFADLHLHNRQHQKHLFQSLCSLTIFWPWIFNNYSSEFSWLRWAVLFAFSLIWLVKSGAGTDLTVVSSSAKSICREIEQDQKQEVISKRDE